MTRSTPVKRALSLNVLEAALKRLEYIFDNFDKVYVSFSGGKDSNTLLHLALFVARHKGRLPLDVLFIDLEAQYQATIEHVTNTMRRDDVRPHWICLPLHLRNAVSNYQPHWLCWDPLQRERWTRELPGVPGVLSDEAYFPFFHRGMEFEEFTREFADWFSEGKLTACLVGIRAGESLNRWRTIKNDRKGMFGENRWTTRLMTTAKVYNAYPIYDWSVNDIWLGTTRFGWPYNKIYDLMQAAGVPLSAQRICQPYGDDQRKGLWLYHILEPDTWSRVVERVAGANFGAHYSRDPILGSRSTELPPGMTWKTYTKLLLRSLPPMAEEHYRIKFLTFLLWWKQHRRRYGVTGIADAGIHNPSTGKNIPSWERLARVIIKNDWWCHDLKFAATKRHYAWQLAAKRRLSADPGESADEH